MEFVIIIIVLMLITFFLQYNIIVKLKMRVKQDKSGIDVYCQQRFDLIPNLVETVKGYMKHEKDILENVTSLRTQYNNTKDLKIGQELNNKMNKIIATAEGFPDLKASEQFLNLQRNLEKIESQLQAARRIYNNDVTNYNIKISTIPYNIVAIIFKFKSEPLFEIENIDARNNIKLD